MLEFFKLKYEIFSGLDAPIFALVIAAFLILVTILVGSWFFWELRRQIGKLKELEDNLQGISPHLPGEGLKEEDFKRIESTIAESNASLKSAWREFESHVVKRRTRDKNSVFYWSTSDVVDVFSTHKLTTESFRFLSRDFYQSFPSILTGVGLLTTFFAILVALLDVKLVDNRVQGLELLIQGLSGKFITSVVALVCATGFVVSEKFYFHCYEQAQLNLVRAVQQLVPQLSPVHALVDIQDQLFEGFGSVSKSSDSIEELIRAQTNSIADGFGQLILATNAVKENVESQTVCIQDFNTGLAPMLNQAFDESMSPTLQRMITSIEGLNEHLRAAEAERSDSIIDSVTELLDGLKSSLTGTLTDMGGRFNESLSGGAQQQFEAIATTLQNTTKMLDSMNHQFALSQQSMSEMIEHTRTTTSEQINLNHGQLSKLSETIGALMTGLSTRVDELGARMTQSVQENSEQAAGAADRVINKAEEWANENAAQLTRLLSAHESQMDRVVDTRQLLDETIERFNGAISNLARVAAISSDSVETINLAAGSLAKAAENTSLAQTSLKSVAELSAKQLEALTKTTDDQEQIWRQIGSQMEKYQTTFELVESSSQKVLGQIGQNLENYQTVCEQGFNNLIESSDNHFTNASRRLGASVDELNEVLENMSDIFSKLEGGRLNGR